MGDKLRENRLRRMAGRRGLVLMKSRCRDPGAYEHDGWMIADAEGKHVVFGAAPMTFSASINDVEQFLEAYSARTHGQREELSTHEMPRCRLVPLQDGTFGMVTA